MTTQRIGLFSLLPLALLAASAQAKSADDFDVNSAKALVAAGDCVACHTGPGGKPFAGGLTMTTPVGDIYSTNITPDKETGIGDYSYEEFARALREGVAKDGHHLYPAMPYTSFAKINDEDMHLLYRYFMTQVAPVKQANRDSDIPWPLSMRWPLAVWNMLFQDSDRFKPDAGRSAEWNRGAYLVQGLAHCGTCHTPRGIAFQEKGSTERDADFLTGGTLEGWHAPDLTSNMKSGIGRWSVEEITQFLKTGQTAHSAAFGSMTDVIENSTQYLSDADLRAIAVYLRSLKSSDTSAAAPQANDAATTALTKGDVSHPGAQEYVDNCSACHGLNGKGYANTFPALAHNPAVLSDDPSSLISVTLRGSKMAVTGDKVTGLTMPGFAWRLDDEQAARVLTFIRSSWGNEAPKVEASEVSAIRKDIPHKELAQQPALKP